MCNSSRKDYNRVLATQPQTSIHMPRFQAPDNFQNQMSIGALSVSIDLFKLNSFLKT